jgi:hypothetical protein
MHHMRRLFAVLLLSSGIGVSSAAPLIEALRDSEVQSTCGCNFQLPASVVGKERTFLQWSEGDDAFMRVDGSLVKLNVIQGSSKTKKPGTISVGDVVVYKVSNESIRVKATCTATQVCAPDDDQCESVGYRAVVTVKAPSGTTSIKATGACGC